MGLCTDYRGQLEASMQDELCDAGFYAQIANEAPTEELRELIISIVGDEYGHARLQARCWAFARRRYPVRRTARTRQATSARMWRRRFRAS